MQDTAKTSVTSAEPTAELAHQQSTLQDVRGIPSTPGTLQRNISGVKPYSAFSKSQRRGIVWLAACGSFWSPITANVYFPAIPLIASDLGVSVASINLTVTIYLIAQGISPPFWSPLSDSIGRRPIYIICLLLYIAASLGLAFAHTYGQLVGLRFMQACGSASVIALGSGTVGDVAPPSERGYLYGLFSLSFQLGPSVGPILGGAIADRLGWNAIFYILAAGCGAVVLAQILLLPETLRAIVDDGSRKPPLINRPLLPLLTCEYTNNDDSERIIEPFRSRLRKVHPLDSIRLLFEKDVACLLAFTAVQYAIYTAGVVSLAQLLQTTYRLNTLQIGLCFIANGAGCLSAGPTVGRLMNISFRSYAKDYKSMDGRPVESPKDIRNLASFPIEKARLRTLFITIPLSAASFLAYGWLIGKGVNLAGPLIFQFIIGLATNAAMSATATLVIDIFPTKAASVTASNNLCRCLLGAAVTSAIQPLLDGLGGAGPTFSLLTGIYVLALPLLGLEWSYGQQWRNARRERLARGEQEKQQSIV